MTSATLVTPASTRSESAPRAIPQTLVRAHQRAYIRTIFVIDSVIIAASVAAGYYLRFHSGLFGGEPNSPVPYAFVILGLTAVWLISLKLHRGYDDRLIGYGAEEYRRVASATLRLAGTIAIFGYMIDLGVARWFLALVVRDGPRRPDGGPLRRAQVAAPGAQARRRLVASGAGGRGHAARHRARAHAAPRAVHRVPRRGGLHPGRPARAGAAAPRRRAGGRLVPHDPRGGRDDRRRHRRGDGVRRADRDPPAPPRLAARGHRHRPGAGAGADRRGRSADPHPAGGRAAADPRGGAGVPRRAQARQGLRRPRAGALRPDRGVAGARGDRDRHQARRAGPGVLPADPRRHGRPRVRRVQVPHDGGQRRRDAGRAAGHERVRRPAVQDAPGPAGHPGRAVPAQVLAGRAAAAGQRASWAT